MVNVLLSTLFENTPTTTPARQLSLNLRMVVLVLTLLAPADRGRPTLLEDPGLQSASDAVPTWALFDLVALSVTVPARDSGAG